MVFAVTTIVVIMTAVVYHRPYWRAPTILPVEESPEALAYVQEFADALTIAGPADYYFSGGGATSPDGRFTLRQRPLRNHYHEITVSRGSITETVLILQEGDPGSGTAHDYGWSRDSKAIFIYGWGEPAGHIRSSEMAIIYLVDRRALFSCDLKPRVAKLLNAAKKAANLIVGANRFAVAHLSRWPVQSAAFE